MTRLTGAIMMTSNVFFAGIGKGGFENHPCVLYLIHAVDAFVIITGHSVGKPKVRKRRLTATQRVSAYSKRSRRVVLGEG